MKFNKTKNKKLNQSILLPHESLAATSPAIGRCHGGKTLEASNWKIEWVTPPSPQRFQTVLHSKSAPELGKDENHSLLSRGCKVDVPGRPIRTRQSCSWSIERYVALHCHEAEWSILDDCALLSVVGSTAHNTARLSRCDPSPTAPNGSHVDDPQDTKHSFFLTKVLLWRWNRSLNRW